MSRISTPFFVFFALALLAAPVFGGPLADDTTVYDDGMTEWRGTAAFQGYDVNNDPSGLSGTIDYAVWAPGTFPTSNFSGFTPTLGDYVYAYQIYVTGTAPLSQSIVLVVNQADTIGTFTGDNGFGSVAGVAPSSSVLNLFSSAEWTFDSGVPGGQATTGLVFDSPNPPEWSVDLLIDDGTFALAEVPAPAGPPIPEPGSLVLAACGFGVLAMYWMRRRVRGVK